MSMCWLTASFNYYLISFLLKYFPGNINYNSMLSVVSEILAMILSGLFFVKFGVRTSFIITFGISFIGGCAILIYETKISFFSGESTSLPSWIFPTLVLMAKFGVTVAFGICYNSNSALFPVLFSATAMGVCNMLARFCSIFAPQVAEIQSMLPMIIFTGLSFLTMVLSSFIVVKDQQLKSKN